MYEIWNGDEFIFSTDSRAEALHMSEAGYTIRDYSV